MTAPSAEAAPAAGQLDVLFRPGRGRWKKLGTATSYAAGLKLVNGPGDYWFRRAHPEALSEPGLFDELGDGEAN